MTTYIVVNKHRVLANQKVNTGIYQPVFRVTQGKYGKPYYVSSLEAIDAHFRVVYSPDRPLPCGARCWLELFDGVTFAEGSTFDPEEI